MDIQYQTIKCELHSASKKIKKTNTKASQSSESSVNKKYNVLTNSKKQLILADLKKGLVKNAKKPFDEDSLSSKQFLEILKEINKKPFRKLLKKTLSKHLKNNDAIKFDSAALGDWGRKIKRWVTALDRPETRGGVIIPESFMEKFRSKLIGVLQNIKFRCFPLLRKHILHLLEEYQKINKGESNLINKAACSKHWWFNFQEKNPDIKEIWQKIPLARSNADKFEQQKMLDNFQDNPDCKSTASEGQMSPKTISYNTMEELTLSRDIPTIESPGIFFASGEDSMQTRFSCYD